MLPLEHLDNNEHLAGLGPKEVKEAVKMENAGHCYLTVTVTMFILM